MAWLKEWLFTIILCLLFVPFFIRAIRYSVLFAFGKIDYANSGTISEEEYRIISQEEWKASEK